MLPSYKPHNLMYGVPLLLYPVALHLDVILDASSRYLSIYLTLNNTSHLFVTPQSIQVLTIHTILQ